MKTWDDWSDADITIAVNNITNELQNLRVIECREGSYVYIGDDDAGTYAGNGEVVGDWHEAPYESFLIDYCDWKDMGPLIDDNDIWIQPDLAGDGKKHAYITGSSELHMSDKNPCRAAAIVFLMMNGVSPDGK